MRGGEGKKSEERKYPVDGFHAPSNTVYEFDGCSFHACSCILDSKSDDAKKQELAVKAERTQQKHAYIRQLGYNLVVMKECQWRQLKQQNERVQSFFFKTHLLCTRGLSPLQTYSSSCKQENYSAYFALMLKLPNI